MKKFLFISGWVIALGAAGLSAWSAFSKKAVPVPEVAAWRDGHGKLGPPLQARLGIAGKTRIDGGDRVDLVLTVRAHADAPDTSIAFLLPRGWSAIDPDLEQQRDFIQGDEKEIRFAAFAATGAPGAVAARVTASGLSREVRIAIGDPERPTRLEGRPGTDHEGRAVTVFPSGR